MSKQNQNKLNCNFEKSFSFLFAFEETEIKSRRKSLFI